MELDLSCFDMELLLDNSLTLVRERAQRHGLALALEVGSGLEEWVADARKVKQGQGVLEFAARRKGEEEEGVGEAASFIIFLLFCHAPPWFCEELG